jgi:SAM-dependent methyltransferase
MTRHSIMEKLIGRGSAIARKLAGEEGTHWARVVMDKETTTFVRSLPCGSLDVLEVSGENWRAVEFGSYRSVEYPEYDLCASPLAENAFDLVIAEQVFEHLLWPYRAARNVHAMLKPGGYFLVTTPFLLKIHDYPVDCSRWTPLGMKHFLAEAGFEMSEIRVGSWGNRACVKSNFKHWTPWIPRLHSLKNEPDFPVVVWAFARRR